MPGTVFHVYLQGKKIDTVFYPKKDTADDVRRSLISHDGYNQKIVVKKARGPRKPVRKIYVMAQQCAQAGKVLSDSQVSEYTRPNGSISDDITLAYRGTELGILRRATKDASLPNFMGKVARNVRDYLS